MTTDDLQRAASDAVDLGARMLADGLPGRTTAKVDRDYVTELDVQIEQAIRDQLAATTPDVGFIGEEQGAHGAADGMTWVLDPIDGTSNMLHGIPLCAVSLGLLNQGCPILGVIDFPFLGERFTASLGRGAYLNGQPIHARRPAALHDAIISVGDFSTGPNAAIRNESKLAIVTSLAARIERVRMLGSAAADLAWVAAGRLDACVLLSNKPWDVTAGVIIAREAGALVTDLDGTEHTPQASATIAAAPTISAQLAQLLGQAVPQPV